MDKYNLPTSTIIAGNECKFNSDYRNILRIFEAMNDPDLLDEEKVVVCLDLFYDTEDYLADPKSAYTELIKFINCCEPEATGRTQDKAVYDWDQDFSIIVAPINKTLNVDVRSLSYLHWWTFISAFMEIGECTFSTFVSIREKLSRGIKLEKHEEKIYRENRDRIILKHKYDSTTQSLIDEIMGKEV